jgi:hypothetical protein
MLYRSAYELFTLAGNLVEIVVCQFAPLLLDLALQLVPISFDATPIHSKLLAKIARWSIRTLMRAAAPITPRILIANLGRPTDAALIIVNLRGFLQGALTRSRSRGPSRRGPPQMANLAGSGFGSCNAHFRHANIHFELPANP